MTSVYTIVWQLLTIGIACYRYLYMKSFYFSYWMALFPIGCREGGGGAGPLHQARMLGTRSHPRLHTEADENKGNMK